MTKKTVLAAAIAGSLSAALLATGATSVLAANTQPQDTTPKTAEQPITFVSADGNNSKLTHAVLKTFASASERCLITRAGTPTATAPSGMS